MTEEEFKLAFKAHFEDERDGSWHSRCRRYFIHRNNAHTFDIWRLTKPQPVSLDGAPFKSQEEVFNAYRIDAETNQDPPGAPPADFAP